jgi:hypothetical protein
MKTYIVELKEVHVSRFEVEAENEEQAKEMVLGGDGDFTDTAYLYTLDDEEPKVTLKKE